MLVRPPPLNGPRLSPTLAGRPRRGRGGRGRRCAPQAPLAAAAHQHLRCARPSPAQVNETAFCASPRAPLPAQWPRVLRLFGRRCMPSAGCSSPGRSCCTRHTPRAGAPATRLDEREASQDAAETTPERVVSELPCPNRFAVLLFFVLCSRPRPVERSDADYQGSPRPAPCADPRAHAAPAAAWRVAGVLSHGGRVGIGTARARSGVRARAARVQACPRGVPTAPFPPPPPPWYK
jgi:hypothetical protein